MQAETKSLYVIAGLGWGDVLAAQMTVVSFIGEIFDWLLAPLTSLLGVRSGYAC